MINKNFAILSKIFLAVILFSICVFMYSCNQNKSNYSSSNYKNLIAKSQKIDINPDSDFVKIDSAKIGSNTLEYRLLFHSKNKTAEVYRIKNQDHSIEFYKSYYYVPLDYVSYQINDLPTGLIWNIFYKKSSNEFYITDKYDTNVIGDTIDRKSVNFSKNNVILISTKSSRNYKINFKRIYPKYDLSF